MLIKSLPDLDCFLVIGSLPRPGQNDLCIDFADLGMGLNFLNWRTETGKLNQGHVSFCLSLLLYFSWSLEVMQHILGRCLAISSDDHCFTSLQLLAFWSTNFFRLSIFWCINNPIWSANQKRLNLKPLKTIFT